MNELQIFSYEEKEIRTIEIDGEPWFVAKDICDVLGIDNTAQALARLDEDERNTIILNEGIGNPEKSIVNEAGLYNLVIRSDKPRAKLFKRWVTHEVLPTIRKTGSYSMERHDLPTDYLSALKALVASEEERVALAEASEAKDRRIAELAPKGEFFDAVTDSTDAIDIGNAAKVLNMGIGRNRLFAFLRYKGVLMPDNVPYQEFIDREYFRTIEQKYMRPDGSTHINIKTVVYQRGLDYIRRLYSNEPGSFQLAASD